MKLKKEKEKKKTSAVVCVHAATQATRFPSRSSNITTTTTRMREGEINRYRGKRDNGISAKKEDIVMADNAVDTLLVDDR